MSILSDKGEAYIMNTYARFPLVLEKGDGVYVYDEHGKEYLDFVAGIAVNSLGHNHKKLAEVIKNQAASMIHISNLYWNIPQVTLSEKLVKNSPFGKVFFCNSGAEAIEGALKLSRKFARHLNQDKYEIIAMENSFHGRTFGAVTATGQKKYQKGLDPMLPGIKHVPFNDFEALNNAVTENTCAVLLEPIQGESGIHPADEKYLKQVRALCSEKDILLIFDEVQCGVGRTGKLFAFENYGVIPDITALAKGMAGGVPIGVLLATDRVAEGFQPGDHASTFGGNPLATAAANVVIDELLNNNLLENVEKQGAYLSEKLNALKEKHSLILAVRGIGLMQGIELAIPARPVIDKCIDKGLLLVGAGDKVIRFVPPLIVNSRDIDRCINILDSVFSSI